MLHFVAGRCSFQPDGGAPVAIAAGDAVFFPANTKGTWVVEETLGKTYVIFRPAGAGDLRSEQ